MRRGKDRKVGEVCLNISNHRWVIGIIVEVVPSVLNHWYRINKKSTVWPLVAHERNVFDLLNRTKLKL